MYESGNEMVVESNGDKFSMICPHCNKLVEYDNTVKPSEIVHVCKNKKHALMVEDVLKEALENKNQDRIFRRECEKCKFKETGPASKLMKITHCPCCKKELELYELRRRSPEEYPN